MAVRPIDPEALHLFQLIGAPLLAVVQAEAQAAQVSADFIKSIGFDAPAPAESPTPAAVAPATAVPAAGAPAPTTPPATSTAVTPSAPKALQDGGHLGAMRMAEFRIDRVAADGTPIPFVARVPVLSLFPIPLLQVKHADFDFDIRVVTRVPMNNDHEDQGTPASSGQYLAKNRVELKGFLASSRGGDGGQAQTDANIKVKVRMEKSDLPAGLLHLMKIMDESVTVAPLQLIEQGKAKTRE